MPVDGGGERASPIPVGITADTALRLGRYFGTTPDVWINLQKRYELETARRELGNTLARIQPRAA